MCILIRKIGYLVNPLAMQELSPSLINVRYPYVVETAASVKPIAW
jgi:hypothetical protein